jgi:hypothetical protein
MNTRDRIMSGDTKSANSLDSVMKCPICEGALQRGYVNVYRGLFWETEKHRLSDGLENFAKTAPFVSADFPARRCSMCNIIIFDYQNRE